MKETHSKLAFVDWEDSKPTSLQPFHLIASDFINFTLFENFALAINGKKLFIISKIIHIFRKERVVFMGKYQ